MTSSVEEQDELFRQAEEDCIPQKVARLFRLPGLDYEDVEQEARIAIMDAAPRWLREGRGPWLPYAYGAARYAALAARHQAWAGHAHSLTAAYEGDEEKQEDVCDEFGEDELDSVEWTDFLRVAARERLCCQPAWTQKVCFNVLDPAANRRLRELLGVT